MYDDCTFITSENLIPIRCGKRIDHILPDKIWDNVCAKNNIITEITYQNNVVQCLDIKKTANINFLGYWNGMGTWSPLNKIYRYHTSGQKKIINQKFGYMVVSCDSVVLDYNNQKTKLNNNKLCASIRKMNHHPNQKFDQIDISKLGYKNTDYGDFFSISNRGTSRVKKILKDDSLMAFCRFAGAYIAEGCASFNKANGSYEIIVSNQDLDWLHGLQKDVSLFCNKTGCITVNKKTGYTDVFNLRINSKTLYTVCVKILGKKSRGKMMPKWIFKLPNEYLRNMLDYMIFGDGYIHERYRTTRSSYTTNSYRLACQCSLAFSLLNIDYSVDHNIEKKTWTLQQVLSYQPNQGLVDRKSFLEEYDGYCYAFDVGCVNGYGVGIGNMVASCFNEIEQNV